VRQAELSAGSLHTLQPRALALGLRLRMSGWNGRNAHVAKSLAPLRRRSTCSLPSFQDGDLVGAPPNCRRFAYYVSAHWLRQHVDQASRRIVIGTRKGTPLSAAFLRTARPCHLSRAASTRGWSHTPMTPSRGAGRFEMRPTTHQDACAAVCIAPKSGATIGSRICFTT
jgi:hypothetical protein